MPDQLQVAIIAGGAALLGSLIPQVFGYFNNRATREFEKTKPIQEHQRTQYSNALNSLQSAINSMGQSGFTELQNAINQIAIFGDANTTRELLDYYTNLVKSANAASPLTASEHQQHQTKIVDAMRKHFGNGPLDQFEMIAFRPSKST